MPYFLLPLSTDLTAIASATPEDIREQFPDAPEYTLRADAHRYKAAHVGGPYEPFFAISDLEQHCWRARERDRFREGFYRPVPWADADAHPDHYAHLSTERTSGPMIAYTANDEDGHNDRQIRVKAGRYLERFYSHWNMEHRSDLIRECQQDPPQAFAIATTADDIEQVYRGCTWASCMGPDDDHVFDVHPSRVYGESDLAVAYTGTIDRATARCVIWPAERRYIRVYGPEAFRVALTQAGYRSGSSDGARIRMIKHGRSSVLMPWCDTVDNARIDGEWIVLGDGPLSTRVQCGCVDTRTGEPNQRDRNLHPEKRCCGCDEMFHADEVDDDDRCASCQEDHSECAHCGEQFRNPDGDTYCRDCDNDRSYCECCQEDYWGNSYWAESRDESVCESCARNDSESKFTCEHCGTVQREWTLSTRRQRARIDNGCTLKYCTECEDDGVHDRAADASSSEAEAI